MSTSTTPTTSTSPRRRKPWVVPNWVYGLGLALLVVAFIGGLTMMFGRVSGEEFSPYEFKRRTFSFYEIPLVRLQVWPIKHIDATGDVETEVVAKKLITIKPPAEPRWDLVLGYRGSAQVAEGDANILCRYFDRLDSSAERTWQTWTQEQPKLAKILWPRIAKLAEDDLYLFMPDLFELAAQASEATDADVAALETALTKLLAQKYHDFGIVQQKLERHDAAVELLTEALKFAPDETAWKDELETSRKALPAVETKPEKKS